MVSGQAAQNIGKVVSLAQSGHISSLKLELSRKKEKWPYPTVSLWALPTLARLNPSILRANFDVHVELLFGSMQEADKKALIDSTGLETLLETLRGHAGRSHGKSSLAIILRRLKKICTSSHGLFYIY
ncbi:hypothetical protein SAY86_009046 [Trapa natans]|uniref:Uncharacterized protein n=1 Tax=Trapa natans TaxID=22666 RepID=A0AAN7QC49_TRANT|nr:hypothetical protein SAY86_009046 [Trapa natans]